MVNPKIEKSQRAPEGYYVYQHNKGDDGTPFYIGVGRRNRAWNTAARSDWWKRIYNKYGGTAVLLATGLDKDAAFTMEKTLIASMGRLVDGTGILVNLSAGGDGGANGYKHTPEQRAKLSKAADRRHARPDYVANRLEGLRRAFENAEVREAISVRQKAAWQDEGFRNKVIAGAKAYANSEKAIAHRERVIKEVLAKPVIRLNDMRFFAGGAPEAVRFLHAEGMPEAKRENIKVALSDGRCVAYGFAWRLASNRDATIALKEAADYVTAHGIPKGKKKPHKVAVKCIETGEVHASYTEAAQWLSHELGRYVGPGMVAYATKTKRRSCHSYHFQNVEA